MPITSTSTSTSGIRPGIRRKTVARTASVVVLVAGVAMIGVSPANALPRACDIIAQRADVYFGYAQAEYGVGDTAEGDRWMRAYYGQVGLLLAYGC
jgi:hypothetical protein